MTVLLWFGAGLLLIYDGIFDLVTSTHHSYGIPDAIEAAIGVVLIVLLVRWARRPV